MDQNAELFLARTGQPTRWEDEEKATNDVEELREEFRRRLYGSGCVPGTAQQALGHPAGPRACMHRPASTTTARRGKLADTEENML